MGVRTNAELTFQIGQDNQLTDLYFDRDLQSLLDTLDHAMALPITLAIGEANFPVPFGDVAEARIVYIEADGEIDVTFGGVLATTAFVTGVAGSYPTGWAGGETFTVIIDGTSVAVVFTGSLLLPAVINEINAAAALLGLGPIASDVGGELRLTSLITGPTSEVEVVAGGSALAALGLSAVVVNGLSGTPGTSPVSIRRPADPTGSTAAEGVTAFFFGTVRTTSITIDNLTAVEVRVKVAIAGDLVDDPVTC